MTILDSPSRAAWSAVRRGGAAFRRLEDTGLVEVTGPDRLDYLHSLLTNRTDDLQPGEAVRAFLLNPTKGRVLAEAIVCETASSTWLECPGGGGPVVLERLRKYYFGQEVEFVDRSAEFAVLSLQGPDAASILTAVARDVPPGEKGAHEETAIGGIDVRALRGSDTGASGYHLWVPVEAVDPIVHVLEEAGAAAGTEEAWTVLQIEAGIASYGRELTDEIIPLEAPTEDAIDHEKGCYPGQEVVARLWARGRPAKELRGLRFEGDEPPVRGTTLDADDKAGVATVTAAGVSPELGPVALAYVHRDYLAPGTRLTVPGGPAAEVADLPLIDRVES